MAKFEDLRQIALGLPLTYEDLHFGGPAFRVKGRKYALRWMATGQTILKLPSDRQEALFNSRPDAIRPIKVGTVFWSVLALARWSRTDLQNLVTDAWSTVVSKTLAREYRSALEENSRVADDWRFLYPAAADSPGKRKTLR